MSLTLNPAFFQHESKVQPSEVSLQDVKVFEMYPHAGIENQSIFIIFTITIFAEFSFGYAKNSCQMKAGQHIKYDTVNS